MRARVSKRLTMADSGLPTDTFSVVCAARLGAKALAASVMDVVEWYGGRPFSWWVAPGDEPEALPEALVAAGLRESEEETAMVCDLGELRGERTWPEDLEVRRARTAEDVHEFGRLLAGLAEPADGAVVEFYRRAAPWLLQDGCPIGLYVGRRNGRSVSTAEVTVAGGVAGLYNVSTAVDERRRGIGSAMTVLPLQEAVASGIGVGVLQAAPEGLGVYERVGFVRVGRIVEYKPGP